MSAAFRYVGGELFAEGVPLARIAGEFGTPCYVYSRAALTASYRVDAFAALPHLVCYAGCGEGTPEPRGAERARPVGSGFDIVSGGELTRVRVAGGDPAKVVFSGVGKSEGGIRAALAAGIRCFNVESEPKLERLAGNCQRGPANRY